MAERQYRTLSKRTVDGLSVEGKDAVFWDHELPGFGVRVYPSGAKVYVIQSRRRGRSKRVTVGRHGALSPDRARKQAAAIIARIKAGEEPVPPEPTPEPTLADLADRYMREHVELHCKASTAAHYRWMLARYIVPVLGELPIAEIERKHVLSLHYELRGKPAAANRAVEMLVKMFNLAELWGLRPDGSNPCRLVRRYKTGRRERFLSPEEYGRLGRVLDVAEAERLASPHGVAAIRLLMLTGCRRNEILGLRWEDVDSEAGELRIRDGKTGARPAPLSPAAARVLSRLPRAPGQPWVFPGKKRNTHLRSINDSWDRIRARAGLGGVRLHDLRHSFASRALALGESLPMIGELLGHTQVGTTARYAHLARDTVRASTAKVADSIGADILPETVGPDATGRAE